MIALVIVAVSAADIQVVDTLVVVLDLGVGCTVAVERAVM